MKSLFENNAFEEIKSRLNALTQDNEKQWGKMSHAQMLHHCQLPLNVLMEKRDYNLKPNWFAKVFFKKAMYSDKPWKKNLPTMPQFKEKEPRDFNGEKEKLQSLLNEFDKKRNQDSWPDHPSFGKFTKEQWGKMQYKHLDHHLRQFNA
ncbi:DUF1569 domain-containing protein [Marinirhabdus gelatinilytica]|uniref:Uncharacterized protein DUF1569 n=1 Tax=Marinirhabdus gelatinilytica TaxID=1703343 RepID=A0A370QLK9_9FLAO|nr:DUF1569 domain-containing protein [Marinirhabdus gelatinilytica]RDK89255.1 uncharacterized protein DUF1569 [Marinirhabdus gelatinilytica]